MCVCVCVCVFKKPAFVLQVLQGLTKYRNLYILSLFSLSEFQLSQLSSLLGLYCFVSFNGPSDRQKTEFLFLWGPGCLWQDAPRRMEAAVLSPKSALRPPSSMPQCLTWVPEQSLEMTTGLLLKTQLLETQMHCRFNVSPMAVVSSVLKCFRTNE